MKISKKIYNYIIKQKTKIFWGIIATILMGITEVFTGAFFKVLTDSLMSISKMKSGKIWEIPINLKIPSPFHEKKIKIIKTVLSGHDEIAMGLLYLALIFLLIFTLKTIFQYFREVFMYSASERILQNFKEDVFGTIVKLPMPFFDENKTGDLVSRVTYDVTTLKEFVNLLIELTRSLSYIIIFIPILFFINWKITLFALIFFPISAILINWFTKKIKKQSKFLTDNIGLYTAFLEEKISHINTIKLFKKEDEEKQSFNRLVEENYLINFKLILLKYVLKPSNELLGILAIVLVFIFFIFQFKEKNIIPFGNIAFYIYILKNTFKPIKKVAESMGELQITLVSTKKIFKLLDQNPEKTTPLKNTLTPQTIDSINFNHVVFGYNNNENIFKNLTFSVHKNEIVAITGKSGAGKTTILKLLKGFYPLKGGTIQFNGMSIDDIGIDNIRELIGEANSDQNLMSGTLMENLKYSNNKITVENVKPYLKFIGIEEKGLNKKIKSGNSQLSSGQKQKLLIVRALLKNPKILILDEVFSSVDSKNVNEIFEFLKTPEITIICTRNKEILEKVDRIIKI